jgi:hypothetical protein
VAAGRSRISREDRIGAGVGYREEVAGVGQQGGSNRLVVVCGHVQVRQGEDDAIVDSASEALAGERFGLGPAPIVVVGDPEVLDRVGFEARQQRYTVDRAVMH